MPDTKGKHLDESDRRVIEDGLSSQLSAREIARRIHVAPSTVTREIKANKTIKVPKRKHVAPQVRCMHYRNCQESQTACERCSTRLTTCKACKTRTCTDSCTRFELRMCEKTERWPYVCPEACPKRIQCNYPKVSYKAREADMNYRARLVFAREGINISPEELEAMVRKVKKLLGQGQSLEAIWIEHGGEMPVTVRTFYTYTERGVMGLSNMDLPRKVRYKKRKTDSKPVRERIDRTGRTYDDFKELSLEDKTRAVQADSVEGYEWNTQRILSLYMVALSFQFFLLQKDGSKERVVASLDALEIYLGSPEAFERIFGIILADRGSEFDDFDGMERSVLKEGVRRCRVFYCDSMQTNQKSPAEKNHEELRKILPKKRSDFDQLTKADIAQVCSHVNSYPRPAKGGIRPIDLASLVVPADLLECLGIVKVAPDDVTMSPKLIGHGIIL